MAYLVPFLR